MLDRMKWILISILICGCAPQAIPGTQAQMDFTRPAFWDAPFPSDDLLSPQTGVDMSKFNYRGVPLVQQVTQMVSGAKGFAISGGIFFQFTGALNPASLPNIDASVQPDSPTFLFEVDGEEPGRRYPLEVYFATDGGPYGAPNLLTLLPLQGVPLHPKTTYAAVVLRSLGDANGKPLGVSLAMAQLADGRDPEGIGPGLATYKSAVTALEKAKIPASTIAGLAAFTTGAPVDEMGVFRADVLSRPLPVPTGPLELTDTFPTYCVYQGTIPMPDYQYGTPPYSCTGGQWTVDANGTPQLQGTELADIYVTIPRTPMPASGYPVVTFINTGAGGTRAIVDRGTQAMNGGPPIVPGSGPAMYFAMSGYAGVSIDGPLDGALRNPTAANEDFLIFNLTNTPALRDNIRESALELVLQAHILASGSIAPDLTQCPGASADAPFRFDTTHMAIMGHSMGATILPLAAAWEPMYGTIILSGAGASWIENVIYKQLPLEVKPLAELLIQEATGQLTAFDPVLTMVQWAGEPADPQVYDDLIIREPASGANPRNVLMEQGIIDHYILPRIANATSLSLGLDLGGPPLDNNPAYVDEIQVLNVLPLVGHGQISLPATGNISGETTDVLVQQPGDMIEDGHEVVFQTDPPKHQYRCLLATWLSGVPTVYPSAAADAPCQ
jgi:hypothetical protein